MIKFLSLFAIFIASASIAQPVKISGVVRTSQGEGAAYANVFDSIHTKGVVADNNGQFAFTLPSGALSITAKHVSYMPSTHSFVAKADTFITITLGALSLQEVLVKGTSLSRQAMIGVNFLEGKTIQNIPTFFGEQDILKAITVLPGIAGGLDLYSSIFVRGGNRDQNLFLVDGARYYTTSHAGGYASLFNPDMIKHIDIYKGGAPARYGDGTSSVIDISLREGGGNGKALTIDLGTLRSGFLAEGKLGKKLSFLVGGRFSYWDFINGSIARSKAALKSTNDIQGIKRFNFSDMDVKLTFTPTPKTTINLNGHLGNDQDSYFERTELTHNVYGSVRVTNDGGNYITNNNITLGIRHVFSKGISIKSTAWNTFYKLDCKYKSDYLKSGIQKINDYYSRSTYVDDLSEKLEVNMPLGEKHFINTGFQVSDFTVNPANIHLVDHSIFKDSVFGEADQNAFESSIFIDDDFHFSEKAWFRFGIRASNLSASDTSYFMVEPRTTLRYKASDNLTFKVGYAITNQPFHVLAKYDGYFEQESWMLANSRFKPQSSEQFSAGVYGNVPHSIIEYSVEGYYKTMNNLLFYAPPNFDSQADNMVDFVQKDGQGKAYGAEVLLQKTNGRIQWSAAYTLSWSERQFDSLNGGEWFYSEFDRRNDLNLGFHYFSSERNTWNFNYIYQSGRAYTLPVASVLRTEFYNGYDVSGGVNNARTPSYKRFDVSYKRSGKTLWGRKTELTLAVMNLFAHRNPFATYVKNGKMYISSWYLVMPSAQLKINLFKN